MPRRIPIALLGSLLLGSMVLAARPGAADAPARDPDDAGVGDSGSDAGSADSPGIHRRFVTARGPVHVWMPTNYRHETAGVVVYVHGYYTDVDDAWREHNLAAQFAASGRNALFIVPEAPAHIWHEVRWNDLGDLIRTVRRRLGLKRPWGPVVAVGHSGAYRTLLPWLDYRPLGHIILLDGLYGHEEAFAGWLDQVKASPNRMTLVSMDTLRWSEPWTRTLGRAHTLDWSPEIFGDMDETARSAQILSIRSQYDHMDIVTRGQVIPVLLQATDLAAVPGFEAAE